MQLSTIDLYRIQSALKDYKRKLTRTLPAEVQLPRDIAALEVRIEQELNERREAPVNGNDTVPV